MGERGNLRPAARAQPRRADVELHGRPDHGQQPDGDPPRLGPGAQGRLPALQGAARSRASLPERLRLQGLWVEVEVEKSLGLESKREIEEYGLAQFAERCKERVAHYGKRDDRPVEAPRDVDGLGQRLLHLLRHQHRVHLAVPQGVPLARLAVQGSPLDTVVPPLRHVAVAARAGRGGQVRRADSPVGLRAAAAARTRWRVARDLDDDTVDAAGERRRRCQARRGVRALRRSVVAA